MLDKYKLEESNMNLSHLNRALQKGKVFHSVRENWSPLDRTAGLNEYILLNIYIDFIMHPLTLLHSTFIILFLSLSLSLPILPQAPTTAPLTSQRVHLVK